MIVEAMRQALEAMELEMKGYAAKHDRLMPAAHALRTAIAKAEKQEPVAWMWKDGTMTFDADRADGTWTPLYTTQPAAQRQPLTEEQIDDIWTRYCDEMGEASINDAYDIARAIEAAHGIKEKNT